jgi:hypothetical protein
MGSVEDHLLGSYEITRTSKFNDNNKPNKALIGNNAANHGIIGYDHGLMMNTDAKTVKSQLTISNGP